MFLLRGRSLVAVGRAVGSLAVSRRALAAYAVVHVDIHDKGQYSKYAEVATKAVKEFGGEFLVRGGAATVMEGNTRERNVVIRFKDVDTAKKFYASPTYERALTYGLPASTRDYVILEGVD